MVDPQHPDALVLSIDQGTSSTKVLLVDRAGQVVARAVRTLGLSSPQPGWIEQDAIEIFECTVAAIAEAIDGLADRIVAIGLSSQRESAVIWDRHTGEPLGPVLGWQDRRTASAARHLESDGHGALVREATGLPIDAMFSALKFAWQLDQVDPDRRRSEAGELALGTVDSWLVFRLTGQHRIEVGNASRTQLLNLEAAMWDDRLLELFRIPRAALPTVVSSVEPSGPITAIAGLPDDVRIHAVLGDSHAALFGHGVRAPGAVKVTYGTGSSIMGLTSPAGVEGSGMVRTIAWSLGEPVSAFEGNILSSGSTLVWLGDLLGLTVDALMVLAENVDDSGGVVMVPAFAGLGAPWWDDRARAVIIGIDQSTTTAHLARAAAESIAHQVDDVLAAADLAMGGRVDTILADGGPSANLWLMQVQADLSQRRVEPSATAELSALGAAYLAGTTVGMWTDDEVRAFASVSKREVEPELDPSLAHDRRVAWLDAVRLAMSPSHPSTTLLDHLVS
ncbi:FGGY-family carbohydrate kinase [soil metagenome]